MLTNWLRERTTQNVLQSTKHCAAKFLKVTRRSIAALISTTTTRTQAGLFTTTLCGGPSAWRALTNCSATKNTCNCRRRVSNGYGSGRKRWAIPAHTTPRTAACSGAGRPLRTRGPISSAMERWLALTFPLRLPRSHYIIMYPIIGRAMRATTTLFLQGRNIWKKVRRYTNGAWKTCSTNRTGVWPTAATATTRPTGRRTCTTRLHL